MIPHRFIRDIIIGLAVILLTEYQAYAQCESPRYQYQVFTNYTLTSDIHYGSNVDYKGEELQLLLDVYEPEADIISDRPLIILAHGGSFVFGAKEGYDVVPLAKDFARMGYVVASINYRMGFEVTSESKVDSVYAMEGVIRAVQDFRAAIRYFKKDYAENGNSFGIDTTKIFVGGVSAGAITAIHVAYMDELSKVPSYVDTTKAGLGGGIEGNSGNPNYTSKGIRGVINICGAIKDTSWITAYSVPILSLHGDSDKTVPYGTDTIWLLDQYPIVEVDGSHSIQERADHLGLKNCLFTYLGADHVPHVLNKLYTDTTESLMRNFLTSVLCNKSIACDYTDSIEMANDVALEARIQVWPNPSGGRILISSDVEIVGVVLYNRLGQKIFSPPLDVQLIDLTEFPKGLYFMEIESVEGKVVKKVVLD